MQIDLVTLFRASETSKQSLIANIVKNPEQMRKVQDAAINLQKVGKSYLTPLHGPILDWKMSIFNFLVYIISNLVQRIDHPIYLV